MSLRHPKIKGINVAIKIMKPQAIPDRTPIATHLEVRMQFASVSGTKTALLIWNFLVSIFPIFECRYQMIFVY